MENPKRFIIPPDLQNKFLIFGLTVPEFVIIVLLVFFAVNRIIAGQNGFVFFPITAFVLFFRTFENSTNLITTLTRRSRFYIAPQIFSLKGEYCNGDKENTKLRH